MLSLRTGTKAAIRHEIGSSCLADTHWPAAESSKRQSHRLPNESPQRPFSSSSTQRGKSRIARPAGSKKEQILLNAFRFAEQLQPITSPSPAPDDKSRGKLEAADLDLPLKEPSIDTQIRKSMWPLENLYKHNSNIATHDKRYKKAYKEVLTRIGHSFTTIQLRSILRELSDGRLKSKEAKSMQKTIALQQVMLAYGWQTPTDAGPGGADNVPLVKKSESRPWSQLTVSLPRPPHQRAQSPGEGEGHYYRYDGECQSHLLPRPGGGRRGRSQGSPVWRSHVAPGGRTRTGDQPAHKEARVEERGEYEVHRAC